MLKRREVVAAYVQDLNKTNSVIDSVEQVKKDINRDHAFAVKEAEVLDVMKNGMGMRFRKIVKASLHLNTSRNQILR